MITKPTLFVFGAGLSKHYGFPLGGELVRNICKEILTPSTIDSLTRPSTGTLTSENAQAYCIYKAVHQWRTENGKYIIAGTARTDEEKLIQDMREFRENLRYSDSISIDSFLRKNPDSADIGKAAIATAISKCEKDESLFFEAKWDGNGDSGSRKRPYQLIWDKLIQGTGDDIKSLKHNRVRFVTFNYDRTWEYYISKVTRSYFNQQSKTDTDWSTKYQDTLNYFRPYHVYGSLGNLEDASGEFFSSSNIQTEVLHIVKAINNIKTIGEARINDETYHRYRHNYDIKIFERIIFLGFGYNTENIQQLELRYLLSEDTPFLIMGSSLDFTKAAKELANRNISKSIDPNNKVPDLFSVNFEDKDCYDFLASVLPEIE